MFSSGISEMVQMVEDVETAARFYEEMVGLTLEKEADEEWAWFWAGEPGEALRVALRKGPLLFEEHSPLPEAVEHVRGKGVEVEADGKEWLADVGFGAALLEPIPFSDGAVSRQGGWAYGLENVKTTSGSYAPKPRTDGPSFTHSRWRRSAPSTTSYTTTTRPRTPTHRSSGRWWRSGPLVVLAAA